MRQRYVASRKISIHLMLLFIYIAHIICILLSSFNTSHVTLYRQTYELLKTFTVFQYISCYSLSLNLTDYHEVWWTFQYISCYSLSGSGQCGAAAYWFQYISCYSLSHRTVLYPISCIVSIHLMLLFIFVHNISTSFTFHGFNTSHVTLYQQSTSDSVQKNIVSIHLMLLFIVFTGSYFFSLYCGFNTSHVTLYRSPPVRSG